LPAGERLPNGSALVLTADDLERLAFLVRGDEPEPPAA
jgi:hypothetical protein